MCATSLTPSSLDLPQPCPTHSGYYEWPTPLTPEYQPGCHPHVALPMVLSKCYLFLKSPHLLKVGKHCHLTQMSFLSGKPFFLCNLYLSFQILLWVSDFLLQEVFIDLT